MAVSEIGQDTAILAKMEFGFDGVSPAMLDQVTLVEATLGESLLTPGLQTTLRVHSYQHNLPIKVLDNFKNKTLRLKVERPILERFGYPAVMNIAQVNYRIDNRVPINNNTEEFLFHACDRTLLNDAATLVSKYWKCTSPSDVVSYVLRSCAGARNLDIEGSCCPRDYMAENIHPFQVVNQQADVALANGNDPSFIHFMTYANNGTHHFRSLNSLTKQSPIMEYVYSEVGIKHGYGNPSSLLTLSFPCDFDLLSDILNGIGPDGADINSFAAFNPLRKMFNLFGDQTKGCGVGSAMLKIAMSNMGSEAAQQMCPDYAKYFILKRQARMGLLEQDKIALRVVVPWNPILHAGQVIRLTLQNKEDPDTYNYGTGNYLIHSMTHTIKQGGYAASSLDCVSVTVGGGIV